jgi:hypothetical protein
MGSMYLTLAASFRGPTRSIPRHITGRLLPTSTAGPIRQHTTLVSHPHRMPLSVRSEGSQPSSHLSCCCNNYVRPPRRPNVHPPSVAMRWFAVIGSRAEWITMMLRLTRRGVLCVAVSLLPVRVARATIAGLVLLLPVLPRRAAWSEGASGHDEEDEAMLPLAHGTYVHTSWGGGSGHS